MKPAITPATRAEALARLKTETFDVLILGGGINGAGTARDLALRAKVAGAELRIGLVEKNHFSSGTSGKNSHLIHGGLRYLKMLDFRLVKEALHERAVLLKIAPHLVEPQPFLMPFAGFGRELFYSTGLFLYDFLSGNRAVPRHRRLSLAEVKRLEPGLGVPGMTAAAEFYDGKVRSARLVLENIFEAVANGAACANYVSAESRTRESDGLWKVGLRDSVTGQAFETRVRALVDATGPWSHDPAPRLVRGSHIVLPRLNASDHAIAYFEESGRIIFFIPWGERDDRTLVGTTDVDHPGSADDVNISDDEVAYLRAIAARVYPESKKYEPLASFSSLRPLLASGGSPTKASREHRIFFDPQGMLRITGGKYTTYRSMSEESADLLTGAIAPALREVRVTADHPLNGNSVEAVQALSGQSSALAERFSLTTGDLQMLIKQYGVLTPVVLDYLPDRETETLSKVDAARFEFAVRHEMALQPRDFLEVSTSLALEGSAPAISMTALT